jgi:hypothetical protein
MSHNIPEPMEYSKGTGKGKTYSYECQHLKTQRLQINDLMLYLKILEKQEQVSPKISRRREIIRIELKSIKLKTKNTMQRLKRK